MLQRVAHGAAAVAALLVGAFADNNAKSEKRYYTHITCVFWAATWIFIYIPPPPPAAVDDDQGWARTVCFVVYWGV